MIDLKNNMTSAFQMNDDVLDSFGLKDVERTVEELFYEYSKNPNPYDDKIGISRRAEIILYHVLPKLIENTEHLKKNLKRKSSDRSQQRRSC